MRDHSLIPDMLRELARYLDANDDMVREVMPLAVEAYERRGMAATAEAARTILASWNDTTPNEFGDTRDGMQISLRQMADYIEETEGLTALSATFSMRHPEIVKAFRKLADA